MIKNYIEVGLIGNQHFSCGQQLTQKPKLTTPALTAIMTNQHNLAPGLNDSAVAAYYSLMVESAVILGAERREAEQQLLDVLNFETTLANVS